MLAGGALVILLSVLVAVRLSATRMARVADRARPPSGPDEAQTAPAQDSLLRTLLHHIPAAVAYVDSEQRYRFTNQTYADWFARGERSLEGLHVREVLGDPGYAEVRPLIEGALSGHGARFERRLAGEAGDRWIEAAYVPRLGEDGSVLGYCFLAQDLTNRHAAELDLARSERRLRTVIENAPAMIAYWDRDCRLVHANAEFARGLGVSGQALIGKTAREVFGEQSYAILQPLCALAARGQASAFEQRLPGRDGTDGHFRVELLPDQDGQGQHGVFMFALDITEPTRLIEERTRELLAAKDAAEAANRVKDEIVANVSHELRTPLHAIAGFAGLGLTHAAPQDAGRHRVYFERIRTSATRLHGFVDDILHLARLGSGEVTPRLEPTDLARLVRDVVSEMDVLLAQSGQRVSVTCASPPPVARLDRHLIQRVMLNLLSNARKFSPSGSEIIVSITGSPSDAPDGGTCLIAVADQGPGVPEHELETIFDPFVQSSRTDRKAGGTGLGLPIVRRIIELHGGWIRARNGPAGGACFEFEIPHRQTPPASGGRP